MDLLRNEDNDRRNRYFRSLETNHFTHILGIDHDNQLYDDEWQPITKSRYIDDDKLANLLKESKNGFSILSLNC